MTTIETRAAYRPLAAIPLSAVVVAVAAAIVNSGIAFAAVALGVESLPGLQPVAFLSLTVFAAIGGAVGWHLINRFTRRPSRVLAWLVPAFLVVSFVPDIAMGLMFGLAYALSLAAMHVATIAIAVAVYRRLLPLRDRSAAATA